jgi:hypothetical protein
MAKNYFMQGTSAMSPDVPCYVDLPPNLYEFFLRFSCHIIWLGNDSIQFGFGIWKILGSMFYSCPFNHGHIARGDHGLAKVSPGPTMPYPTLLHPVGGPPHKRPYGHFMVSPLTGLAACGRLLPFWTPHDTPMTEEERDKFSRIENQLRPQVAFYTV